MRSICHLVIMTMVQRVPGSPGLMRGCQKQHSGTTGCFVSNSWLHGDLAWTCSNPLPVSSKEYLWLSILKGRRPHQ